MPKKTYMFPVALLAACCLVIACQRAERSAYRPRVVEAVSSTELANTEIVPTLDTPLAKSGNAVWCATFQVAWNEAKDDLIKGPLRIANAQPLADRLNTSPVTEAALPPGSYFAAAGRFEDGIIRSIRRRMAAQFPGVQVPEVEGTVGFMAYAFLNSKVIFTTPFGDTREPIQFSDAAGVTHSINGFGLQHGSDWDLLEEQAGQVKVLFNQMEDLTENEVGKDKLTAFALDLTADRSEHQVIIAMLPRAEHLRAALQDLARRINQFAPDEYSENVHAYDTLAIPNIAFHVNHEFSGLQGVDKIIENSGEFHGLYMWKAWQSVHFRLDKSGATVISAAEHSVMAVPRRFIVDKPFLIVMKRRLSGEPYFVAWIDNAELLELTGGEAGNGD